MPTHFLTPLGRLQDGKLSMLYQVTREAIATFGDREKTQPNGKTTTTTTITKSSENRNSMVSSRNVKFAHTNGTNKLRSVMKRQGQVRQKIDKSVLFTTRSLERSTLWPNDHAANPERVTAEINRSQFHYACASPASEPYKCSSHMLSKSSRLKRLKGMQWSVVSEEIPR